MQIQFILFAGEQQGEKNRHDYWFSHQLFYSEGFWISKSVSFWMARCFGRVYREPHHNVSIYFSIFQFEYSVCIIESNLQANKTNWRRTNPHHKIRLSIKTTFYYLAFLSCFGHLGTFYLIINYNIYYLYISIRACLFILNEQWRYIDADGANSVSQRRVYSILQ